MKQYLYEINGRTYRVKVKEVLSSRAVVEVNDVEYQVRIKEPAITQADVVSHPPGSVPVPEVSAARRPVSPPSGNGLVRAPMPGVVLRVLLQAGDQVSAGDTVLIIEAMKMENEIKAPIAGTIQKIMVDEGDSVNTNDELFLIRA